MSLLLPVFSTLQNIVMHQKAQKVVYKWQKYSTLIRMTCSVNIILLNAYVMLNFHIANLRKCCFICQRIVFFQNSIQASHKNRHKPFWLLDILHRYDSCTAHCCSWQQSDMILVWIQTLCSCNHLISASKVLCQIQSMFKPLLISTHFLMKKLAQTWNHLHASTIPKAQCTNYMSVFYSDDHWSCFYNKAVSVHKLACVVFG